MARFPEQRLWDRIRRNLGREIHIERIENAVAAGMPDTLVIHRGFVTFVEHKTATLPKRNTTPLQWRHKLTSPQKNWHRMYHQNGGTSYIIVGVNHHLHALPGRMVDEITEMPFVAMQVWRLDYIALANLYKGLARL